VRMPVSLHAPANAVAARAAARCIANFSFIMPEFFFCGAAATQATRRRRIRR
jgi:hypothetical protein